MSVKPAAGTTISIGTTASDPTADSYTLIGSLAAIPSFGDMYTDVPFENLGTSEVEHNTGPKDAPSGEVSIGRDLADAGQAAVLAANGVNSWYNFKITYPDSSKDFFKAKVQGWSTAPGGLTGNIMATFKVQPKAGTFTLNAAGAAPVNSVLPSISGVAQEGVTLTAYPGVWSGGPTFTYQWKKDGTNISGATSAVYTPVTGDVDGAITVAVTGTNAAGSATATSAATVDVIAA